MLGVLITIDFYLLRFVCLPMHSNIHMELKRRTLSGNQMGMSVLM